MRRPQWGQEQTTTVAAVSRQKSAPCRQLLHWAVEQRPTLELKSKFFYYIPFHFDTFPALPSKFLDLIFLFFFWGTAPAPTLMIAAATTSLSDPRVLTWNGFFWTLPSSICIFFFCCSWRPLAAFGDSVCLHVNWLMLICSSVFTHCVFVVFFFGGIQTCFFTSVHLRRTCFIFFCVFRHKMSSYSFQPQKEMNLLH